MYVKVDGYPTRIYETDGETVEVGSIHWWHDAGHPRHVQLVDLLNRIGGHADVYDLTRIGEDPTGYKDGDKDKPFWKLRWARFKQLGSSEVKMIVCTGPLYVLGSNGKTIDRAA